MSALYAQVQAAGGNSIWAVGDATGVVTVPEITGPSGAAGALTSTKSMEVGSAAVHTFTASEAVTWSLDGGADAALFSINASTGALIFVNPLPTFNSVDLGATVRKATNSGTATHADGFVLSNFASGALALVHFIGTNDQVTGLVPGPVYLGVGGGLRSTPLVSGGINQRVGYALSPTSVVFQRESPEAV